MQGMMGKLAPQFAGRQQCDSQEFLQYFLGALHKELKCGVMTSVDCEKTAESDKVMPIKTCAVG